MREALIGRISSPSSGFLLVEGHVRQALESYRQNLVTMPESGGILLGYRRADHLHVVDATVPSSHDRRARTRFFRSANHHQDAALSAWKKSGKRLDYIGEWHTHPEFKPSPSGLDLSEWIKLLERQPSKAMVFVILGMVDQDWFGVGAGHEVKEIQMHSEC